MPCGATALARVGSVTSAANGAWRWPAILVVSTVYQVSWKNTKSVQLTARVAPQFLFRRVRAHRFAVTVTAAQGFVGKFVVVQRYYPANVKRVRLSKARPGAAPTLVSSASFGAAVPRRTRLRVLFTQDQVGTCYTATHTGVVRA